MKWNDDVKLIVSDVDETAADLYVAASDRMVQKLDQILSKGIWIFFVSGQSIESIEWRIVNKLQIANRKRVMVGSCSGSEVWAYSDNGERSVPALFSPYDDIFSNDMKSRWRQIVDILIDEFDLKIFPTMTVGEFKQRTLGDKHSVMLEDRGPQITFEFVNDPEGRGDFVKKASILLTENEIPITARLGGEFAIDLAMDSVSKTTAVKFVLNNDEIMNSIGIDEKDLSAPNYFEIWGDKFSTINGGTDRHISEAFPSEVRSIDFRHENTDEFLKGYNIVLWDGKFQLQDGLLEYLDDSFPDN